ncbi:MAG: hypothetical protein ABSF59_17410 [Candidatus Sulfotelmatobacter sp.]|jgi:hypothetical protein
MAEWFMAALVIAGWLLVYVSSRRGLERACAQLRSELQPQIDALAEAVRAIEHPSGAEEIAPETLAAITETITGLLGRKVRIRSVKRLHAPEAGLSSWAQQGRVVVQASHNLAQRGHEK